MITGIFEVLMLLCFAAAWPFSIYRQYKTKSGKGKSILFSYIIMLGYTFGIVNKIISEDVNYVLFFYVLDMALVLIDTVLYYKNTRAESA